jgi:hypothetical protein
MSEERLTDEEVDEIADGHVAKDQYGKSICAACSIDDPGGDADYPVEWPCDAAKLLTEVRRLRGMLTPAEARPTVAEITNLRNFFDRLGDGAALPATNAGEVVRAIDELLRLRSDEWLRAAAEEIDAHRAPADDGGPIDHDRVAFRETLRPQRVDALLAILRQHRNGKA